jgi:Protein of unknown function (DUF3604)
MPINTEPRYVGRAWIAPAGPVVAGETGSWTITYEVGLYGYDEFARLKIACRFASDWGTPQFSDPAGANYATVRLESRCPTTIAHLSWEPRGYIRPWFKCLVVSIRDGSLYPGDKVHVTLGDRGHGGRGSRAQTFRERGCEWRVLVDPFGTELYSPLAGSPTLDIVGGDFHRLVVIAPTTVRAGESFEALVKAEDVWGNPCERFTGDVTLSARGTLIAGLPPRVTFRSGDLAVATLGSLRIADAGGETRIIATRGDHRAESNLVRAVRSGEPKTWWGDLHGQTRATVGTGTIEEYFAFGREVALLDMMCHQANDFQVTDEEWRRLRREIDRFHQDGRCVIFVGYEWSGMTPGGGDRNVMFRGDVASLHRSSHAEVDDMRDAATDCFPVTELFGQFAGRDDVMLIPHIGGRYADIVGFHDVALEPVVEIYSDWGRFEWLLEDAIRNGYKVGFVANSDGHKGRPGASHPGASTFGAYGGLTCVLAESLTREAVFDAIKARRCYAVTGAQRIHVEMAVNGLPMGAAGRAEGPVVIAGRAVGTGPIESIRPGLVRGLEPVPDRLGRLPGPGARPTHHVGRPRRALRRTHRRRGSLRDGKSRKGNSRADRRARRLDLEHDRRRRRRRRHGRCAGRRGVSIPHAGHPARGRAQRPRRWTYAHVSGWRGRSEGVLAAPACARSDKRPRVRIHRPFAAARPVPSLLDPGDSGGRRAGLDEPRLPRPLSARRG